MHSRMQVKQYQCSRIFIESNLRMGCLLTWPQMGCIVTRSGRSLLHKVNLGQQTHSNNTHIYVLLQHNRVVELDDKITIELH